MLNKFTILIVVLCGCQILTSCQSSEEQELKSKQEFWGEVNYFDDFLWSKYESEILTKTICIDLNKEALKSINEIEFGVYELNPEGQYVSVSTDNVQFYINGEKCDNNEFEVKTEEHTEIDLGVELDDNAQEGTLTYFLKILEDDIVLDRVNDLIVDRGEMIPAAFELKVQKNDNVNSLKAGTVSLSTILLIAFLVWIIVLRQIFYSKFKIIRITFDGQDFNEDVYFTVIAKGAYKIVFSNKMHKQNIFSKIFTGKVQYVSNPFFADGEMEAIPAPNKSVRFRPGRAGYIVSPRNILNRNDLDSTISSSISKIKITIL